MLKDLVRKNRSYRRFYQSERISEAQLLEWVDLARHAASARNMQPLKYLLSWEEPLNAEIFEQLAWAGYLADWPGPEEGERPSAYMVQVHDTTLSANYLCDDGIAAQTILLGATEAGFGGCMIYSVNRAQLSILLGLPDEYRIVQVIALGKPRETVVLEEMQQGDVRYWRDENQVHHVPKRSLEEIVLKSKAKQ